MGTEEQPAIRGGHETLGVLGKFSVKKGGEGNPSPRRSKEKEEEGMFLLRALSSRKTQKDNWERDGEIMSRPFSKHTKY